MEQYWLSYINALINEKKFEEADQFIKKAEKNNISSDKLGSLIKRVSSFSSKKSINKKSPSKKKIRILSEHYDNKRYDNAEKMALSIIEKFPENPYSWKILGSLRSQTGRYYEAIEANEKAVKPAAASPSLSVKTSSLAESNLNSGLIVNAPTV